MVDTVVSKHDREVIDAFLRKCFPVLYDKLRNSFEYLEFKQGDPPILSSGKESDGSLYIVFKGPVEVRTDKLHVPLHCGNIFGEFEEIGELYEADVIAGNSQKDPDIDFFLEWNIPELGIGKSNNVIVIKASPDVIKKIKEDIIFWRELCKLKSQKIKRIQWHYFILRESEIKDKLKSLIKYSSDLGDHATGITDCGDGWKLGIGIKILAKFIGAKHKKRTEKIIEDEWKGKIENSSIFIPKEAMNPVPEGSVILSGSYSSNPSVFLNVQLTTHKNINADEDKITFKTPKMNKDGFKDLNWYPEDIVAIFPNGGSGYKPIEYKGKCSYLKIPKHRNEIRELLLAKIGISGEVIFLYPCLNDETSLSEYKCVKGSLIDEAEVESMAENKKKKTKNIFSWFGISIKTSSQHFAFINLMNVDYVICDQKLYRAR